MVQIAGHSADLGSDASNPCDRYAWRTAALSAFTFSAEPSTDRR